MAQQSSPSPPRRQTPRPTPQYVEVNCASSGKKRRFAAGTDAGFAVALINRKLKGTVVPASYIEAVKDGEESIAFGPTSLLSDFGDGWKLQTVTLTDLSSEVGNEQFQQMRIQAPGLGVELETDNCSHDRSCSFVDIGVYDLVIVVIPCIQEFGLNDWISHKVVHLITGSIYCYPEKENVTRVFQR